MRKLEVSGEALAKVIRGALNGPIGAYHKFDKETEYEALRLLLASEPTPGKRREDAQRGDETTPEERRWSDLCLQRVYWIARHLWYRGLLKPRMRYRKPGLQPRRQQVNWRYVAECYRREHPDDQASQKALEVTYGKTAMLIDARRLFELFQYLYTMQCTTALIRFFSHGLSLEHQDHLNTRLDELMTGWEIPMPPAGGELIDFALAHWEEIRETRRPLLPPSAQEDEAFGDDAKHALEGLRDYLRTHHAIPAEPLTYHSTRYAHLTYRCQPYNVLDDSPAPLYFVEDVQVTVNF